MPSSGTIARAIIDWMGADNDVHYLPSDEDWERLHAAIERMLAAGWTPDLSDKTRDSDIVEIGCGEESERAAKFDGYHELDAALDRVFEVAEQEDP